MNVAYIMASMDNRKILEDMSRVSGGTLSRLTLNAYTAIRDQLENYNTDSESLGRESYSTGDVDIVGRKYAFRAAIYSDGDGHWTRILSVRTENMMIALDLESFTFTEFEPLLVQFGLNNYKMLECPHPRFEIFTTAELAEDDIMFLKLSIPSETTQPK